MQKVRDKVNVDGNLEEINEKIQNDEDAQSYFAHTMDGEISMIQTLNEVHRYCMNSDHSNSASDDPEISDDASEESKEYDVDNNDANNENEEENEENEVT